MEQKVYKFIIYRNYHEAKERIEYLDETLFLEKINNFIKNYLLFDPRFPSCTKNSIAKTEYLLDFILLNSKNTLLLCDVIINKNNKYKKRCELIKKYIKLIDDFDKKYDNWGFYSSVIYDNENCMCANPAQRQDEAYMIFKSYIDDFSFPFKFDPYEGKLCTKIVAFMKKAIKTDKSWGERAQCFNNLIKMLCLLHKFYYLRTIKNFGLYLDDYQSECEFCEDIERKKINMILSFLNDELYSLFTWHRWYSVDVDISNITKFYLDELKKHFDYVTLEKYDAIKTVVKFNYLFGASDSELFGETSSSVFDVFSGFDKNIDHIKSLIKTNLNKYSLFDYETDQYVYAIAEETIFSNSLLASAVYQKLVLDYTPIYKGMEYTPILVNLFKSVEELVCTLIEKLSIDKMKDRKGNYLQCCKYIDDGNQVKVCFDDKEWKDKIMLTGLKNFINNVNTGRFDMYLDSKDMSIYHRAYNDFKLDRYWIDLRLEVIKNFEKFNAQFGSKYDCTIEINMFDNSLDKRNSDILKDNFEKWIKICRNGTLHKHNVFDAERAEFCFEFSIIMINALFEWYAILKEKAKTFSLDEACVVDFEEFDNFLKQKGYNTNI